MNFWFKIGFVLLVLFVAGVVHEMVHGVIFEEYGCSYRWGVTWGYAYTMGNCSGLSVSSMNSLNEAQANVESFGYQYLLVLVVLVLIWIELREINEFVTVK